MNEYLLEMASTSFQVSAISLLTSPVLLDLSIFGAMVKLRKVRKVGLRKWPKIKWSLIFR